MAHKNFVWIHDDEEAFAKANIITQDETKTVVEWQGGDRTLDTAECLKVNPDNQDGVPDNTELMFLNDASLLHNLRCRYEMDKIYTYTGYILIAINPYKDMGPIYDEDVMFRYKGKSIGTLEPHVYAVADHSYRAMKNSGSGQSVIISGESGAGKTETSKIVMRYLAVVGGTMGDDGLEGRMMRSNPILEAFGNAKTLRNNNSSRFGKFMKIEFDRDNLVCSASIDTYLLEKSRIVTHTPGERAYHSFYQICAGPRDLQDKLQLRRAEDFEYLGRNGGEYVVIDGVDDAQEFDEMSAALDECGFDPDEKDAIFQIVAGVLHLGNVEFDFGAQDNAQLRDSGQAETVADMFMVEPGILKAKLVTKLVKVRREEYEQPMNPQMAEYSRDALAKAAYSKLFDHLVAGVNRGLQMEASAVKNFIGVLDIYGFEFFDVNSFEQLCINYANEKLQQHFNRQIFKQEQEIYLKEAIKVAEITYKDNQDCIDLLETPRTGVINILDEECKMPKATDKSFAQKLHKQHSRHPRFAAPKAGKRRGGSAGAAPVGLGGGTQAFTVDEAFVIKHFAGDVTYAVDKFLDKNMDPLNEDVEKMMSQSGLPLIAELFEYEEPDPSARGRKKKKQTVGGRFLKQLGVLADTLANTSSHFIRCIKPNNAQKAGIFEGPKIIDQLRCSGMMEALKLMHEGFPTRCPFDDLYGRYKDLMPPELSDLKPDQFVECLLMALEVPREKYQFGLTKVFFKAGQFALIDELTTNEEMKDELVDKVRIWLMRKRFKRSVFSIVAYKKVMQRVQQLRAGELFASVACQMWVISKTFLPLAKRVQRDRRATKIQSTFRMFTERRDYNKLTKGASVLTRFARRFVMANNAKPLIEDIRVEREEREQQEKDALAAMAEEERQELQRKKKEEKELRDQARIAAIQARNGDKQAQQEAEDKQREADELAARTAADALEQEKKEAEDRAEKAQAEMEEKLAQQREEFEAKMAKMMTAVQSGSGGGGGGISADKEQKMMDRLKALEEKVGGLEKDLKLERKARQELEARVGQGGVAASPGRGGAGGKAGLDQSSDAWQRAKSAAARQVQPPGVAGRAVGKPQVPTAPRPGQVALPGVGGGGGASDFEQKNVEKDQQIKEMTAVVEQIKAHMTQGKRKGVTLGDDSTDPEVGKLIRQAFCDMLIPILNYGFKSFKLFGKHHFWDFLEKLLDDQLEKSNDGSFSVEKQSAKYNLCRAVAIIADIKLMEKNNDMRLRAFICYGLNVQSLHRWMQVLRQNEVLSKKFFEPWSYVQSDHSMQELLQSLQPLASHTFRLALDYEVASLNVRVPGRSAPKVPAPRGGGRG